MSFEGFTVGVVKCDECGKVIGSCEPYYVFGYISSDSGNLSYKITRYCRSCLLEKSKKDIDKLEKSEVQNLGNLCQ